MSIPLHRIRFYDHTPSPITAIQYTPLPLPAPSSTLSQTPPAHPGDCIIARENGHVEIWKHVSDKQIDSYGNWVLHKTLPPTLTHPTISQLVLVIRDPLNCSTPTLNDLRLFTSSSDSGDLVERCLSTGKILQTYPIPSAPIWSLVVAPTHDLLCLSTTAPNLHFLSIPSPTMFDPSPSLAPPPPHLLRTDALPSRTRTTSIAFGPPALTQLPDGTAEWRNTTLVTGNSDSSWRIWEIPAPADGSRQGPNRVVLKGRAVVEKVQKAGRGGRKAAGGVGGQKQTIVWSIGILPDGTVATTDSLGSLIFWDPLSLAQRQHFRAHKADAMCLAIGPGGSTVFTSGPDQRVCQFVRAQAPGGEWVMVSAKRLHAHDVRALAVWPPYAPVPITTDTKHGINTVGGGIAPVLASGGWDMSPTFTPASHPSSSPFPSPLARPSQSQTLLTFESTHPRRMGYLSSGLLSSSSPITFSPSARLVVGKRDRGVGIWRVHPNENGWEKLLEMELRLRTTIVATTISEHGKYLAVSDLYETKLFKLVPTSSGLKPTRLPLLPTLLSSPLLHHLNTQLTTQGCGSTSMVFTPDGGRVVLGLVTGQVLIIELVEDEENVGVEVVKCFERKERVVRGRVIKGKDVNGTGVNGNNAASDVDISMEEEAEEQKSNSDSESESESDSPSTFHSNGIHKQTQNEWISILAVSEDGQWLGVADLEGRVEVFNLDSLQLHSTLPTLPHPPTTLSFPSLPSSSPYLAILSPTNTLSLYNLDQRRFVPLPSLGKGELEKFGNVLRKMQTPVMGMIWRPSRFSHPVGPRGDGEGKALLWGTDYLVTLRVTKDMLHLIPNVNGELASMPNHSASTTNISSINGKGGESKNSRKKRAREARQAKASHGQGEEGGTGVGRDLGEKKEEYYKIIGDRFKSILSVGWLAGSHQQQSQQGEERGDEGELEVGVVERPWGDFVAELPGVFWSGSYGSS
ncbi:U3 small nucleolar RNA-associated protein 4 [Cryptococcus neoformans]|nr:U3 small nucleolar RNA-associated protein 4 [Cryptococcus neoformans var. grubii Bt1]OXG12543.1 U3 small nucleolar RNA-associated protein 4 [Cryptococcus neoformans var. grubii Ze90-1]OXH22811.1 U3 small nucleolar RNA-associated protein 4 [Cryptococcus neoformans var. grubii]